MRMSIGSGDCAALLSGINTKTHQDLVRKFVAENAPYYNAMVSPINALRTGALLEKKYIDMLSDDYFCQYKQRCSEMDIFVSTIDFAKINDGKIVDFDELKTIYLPDFIDIILPMSEMPDFGYIDVLKKTFKNNYNQVQFQLMCSGLDECNIVFLSVETYNDDENNVRVINENDFRKFRIRRDEKIISLIKERGKIFQQIKNYFSQK